MKKRFTDEQIIGFLKQAAEGIPVKELCRKHGFSDASFYLWRRKFGGMDVPDAKRLRELEAENVRLNNMLAETMLANCRPGRSRCTRCRLPVPWLSGSHSHRPGPGVHRPYARSVGQHPWGEIDIDPAGQTDAERLHRKLQWRLPRRVPGRALVSDDRACTGSNCRMASGLQRGAAPQHDWRSDAGSVRPAAARERADLPIQTNER